jgi:hypothetical protein
MNDTYQFYLPFGLEIGGKTYRSGTIRLASALDELEIQNSDDAAMNTRYRDLLLLSRVIENLEDLRPVTVEMLEELYEADFLYLQILYKSINDELETRVETECPRCHHRNQIRLPLMFEDMSVYREA